MFNTINIFYTKKLNSCNSVGYIFIISRDCKSKYEGCRNKLISSTDINRIIWLVDEVGLTR